MSWLTKLCDCFLSVVAKLNLGSKVDIIFYCSKKTLFFQKFRKTKIPQINLTLLIPKFFLQTVTSLNLLELYID